MALLTASPLLCKCQVTLTLKWELEMWANAQRDGRPAESVQRRKVWLTPSTRVPCSNVAKTRNPLKFVGVPQTRQQISAVSRLKFTILSGHVEDVLLFNKFFFPIVDACLSSEDIAQQSCAMVPKWRFLRHVFPASRVQHISDLHSKFALGPHHV